MIVGDCRSAGPWWPSRSDSVMRTVGEDRGQTGVPVEGTVSRPVVPEVGMPQSRASSRRWSEVERAVDGPLFEQESQGLGGGPWGRYTGSPCPQHEGRRCWEMEAGAWAR